MPNPTNKTYSSPDFSIEDISQPCVAGVDEAGRGPLFGNVVAAAAWIDRTLFPKELLDCINDSKKLSPKKREIIFDECIKLKGKGIDFEIGFATPKEIDDINILNATYLAMMRAMKKLINQKEIQTFLIDGNRAPKEQITGTEYKTIIKGDGKSYSIAIASIIAKVTRDREIIKLAQTEKYKMYGLENHKGYGTKEHLTAIKTHGLSDLHRQTFRHKL